MAKIKIVDGVDLLPKTYDESLTNLNNKYLLSMDDDITLLRIREELSMIDSRFEPKVKGRKGKSLLYKVFDDSSLSIGVGLELSTDLIKSGLRIQADGKMVIIEYKEKFYIIPETNCFILESMPI